MLHTLTADREQLDLIAQHIVEPFRDAQTAGAGAVA